MTTKERRLAVLLGFTALVAGLASADTLVLRDGRRVDGDLVGVQGDAIEFRERGLFGGGRVRQYERRDVARIEIEDTSSRDDEAGSGRPSGLREKDVSVQASEAWTETGIQVRSGQEVYFEARGEIRWGKDRKDDAGGEGGKHYNANRPIPGRPGGALIGRVGEGSDYFFIGKEEGPIRVRSSGRLYLGVNDDYLPDNSGAFRVTVYY